MRYLTERSRFLDCVFLRKVELNAPSKTHESFIFSYTHASTWIDQIWDFRIWIVRKETKRAFLRSCYLLRKFQINALAINCVYYHYSHIFIPVSPNLRNSPLPENKVKILCWQYYIKNRCVLCMLKSISRNIDLLSCQIIYTDLGC